MQPRLRLRSRDDSAGSCDGYDFHGFHGGITDLGIAKAVMMMVAMPMIAYRCRHGSFGWLCLLGDWGWMMVVADFGGHESCGGDCLDGGWEWEGG